MLHRYTLLVLGCWYLILLQQCWRHKTSIAGGNWVFWALICWPLTLTDECMRAFDVHIGWLSGVTVAAPLLCLSLLYRHVKLLVVENPPPSKKVLWVPLGITVISQLPMLVMPLAEKVAWLTSSPVGQPLVNWPVYLPYMLNGFGILVLGILIAELIQNYHRYLPSQAVDIRAFRVKWLGGAIGITVGIAFCCIMLVTAGAFGFFKIDFWQSLYNVLFAIAQLQLSVAAIRPQHTSPSPLDYHRLDALKEEQSIMREAVAKAVSTMAASEAYKQPELRLSAFARDCKVDPTTLVVALRLLEKRDFRSFVYQYRLDYAKKEWLATDASIAAAAKRWGMNSEKFLSEVFVQHLHQRQQNRHSAIH